MKPVSLDLATLGPVLGRRKWSIVLWATIAAAAAFGVTRSLPQRFSSEGALVVASDQPNIPDLTVATTAARSDGEATQTLTDILKSRGLVEGVVNQLGLADAPGLRPVSRLPFGLTLLSGITLPASVMGELTSLREMIGLGSDDAAPQGTSGAGTSGAGTSGVGAGITAEGPDPHEQAVTYVQNHLRVDSKDRSNLLSVQFTAGSPTVAAAVVNAVMNSYIDSDVAMRRAQLAQAAESLTKRAEQLRAEIDADDAQIEKFLQGHDVGQVQGGSVAATQLSALQSQLAAARQDLTRVQTTRESSRGAARSATQESPLLQTLRQHEADLLQRMGGLAAAHPDRLRMEDELRSIRGQIGEESGKMAGGQARDQARDAELARLNVQNLERAVEDAKQEARRSSASEVYFGQLTREAEEKRQLYNSFLTRADQTRLATAQFPTAHVLFPAKEPRRPDTSQTLMPIILGFVGGGILASAMIVLRDLLRGRIMSARDLVIATGLPVFGSLPEVKKRTPEGLPARAPQQVQSLIDETLRAIWMGMRALGNGKTATTVVITSSDMREGKTTVSAALARRVAADGFRVMLIDADLRRPSLFPALSLRSTGRLEAVLSGGVTLDDAVMVDPASGLHCLLAGGGTANPNKLLASDEFARLLSSLRRSYDFVVLDSPPVLRVADAIRLSDLTDHTLFVVQYGRMRGDLVAEAVRRFPKPCRDKMVGLLTRVPLGLLDRRDYYGGYGVTTQPAARALLEPHGAGRTDASGSKSGISQSGISQSGGAQIAAAASGEGARLAEGSA